ncbi:MAG: hypothetical protein SFW07_07045 [Gammaproteobacteria bacterium]|nr:hypothetical protein [Gammaproteobacteria bacterium]
MQRISLKIDLSHFFKKCETIEANETLIQSCAILFSLFGLIEIILGLFVPRVVFPGLLTAALGGILYIADIPSVGMVCFLWAVMPTLGAFTTRFGINFIESVYAIFTLAPLLIGFRAYLATRHLNVLRFPDEDDERPPPKQKS